MYVIRQEYLWCHQHCQHYLINWVMLGRKIKSGNNKISFDINGQNINSTNISSFVSNSARKKQVKLSKHTHTQHVTITSSHHRMNNPLSSEVTDCNQEQFALLQKNQHRWVFLPILRQTDSNTYDSHIIWGEARRGTARRGSVRGARRAVETYTTGYVMKTHRLYSNHQEHFIQVVQYFLCSHVNYCVFMILHSMLIVKTGWKRSSHFKI